MKYNNIRYLLFFIITLFFSCKEFLNINPPQDRLTQDKVFQNDDQATSAQTGIYSRLAITGFASGGINSTSSLCGASSDEMIGYGNTKEYYENELSTSNTTMYNTFWVVPYQQIYAANAILEGLEKTNGVSISTKKQLQGEAYFIRGFSYFYLVNIFGDIPLVLNTDYSKSQHAPRSSIEKIYAQIISDLKYAENLLSTNYITTERIRPNKSAAQAMLARTYLYRNDWLNAEKYASMVLERLDLYKLVNLDDIFLKNSQEAIWQIMPTANTNANEGGTFILTATPTNVSLSNILALNGFEANDKRKIAWIRSFTNSTGTYYYPFKYKIKSATIPTEYSMVLRLAELYLIRSEARAQLGFLNTAIDDLDKIRERAGITPIKTSNSAISKQELLSAILKERNTELFSEWGHRWFDLKRIGIIDSVLRPIKPLWKMTDHLFPIPQVEISKNSNLIQNEGYKL